jgi:hypothetical protein
MKFNPVNVLILILVVTLFTPAHLDGYVILVILTPVFVRIYMVDRENRAKSRQRRRQQTF